MARGFGPGGPGGPGGRPMHDPNDRTPRDTKYILRKLWHYIKQYWMRLALAVGLTFGSNALALWGPSLSGYAIDAIIGRRFFYVDCFRTVLGNINLYEGSNDVYGFLYDDSYSNRCCSGYP